MENPREHIFVNHIRENTKVPYPADKVEKIPPGEGEGVREITEWDLDDIGLMAHSKKDSQVERGESARPVKRR